MCLTSAFRYEFVHKLTEDFPDKRFSLNGGVQSMSQAKELLDENSSLFGVMIGRAAYNHTSILSQIDTLIFDEPESSVPKRGDVMTQYLEYCSEYGGSYKTSVLIKPLTGMTYGGLGSSRYRNLLHQADLKVAERNTDLNQVVTKAMSTMPIGFWDEPFASA